MYEYYVYPSYTYVCKYIFDFQVYKVTFGNQFLRCKQIRSSILYGLQKYVNYNVAAM